MHPVRSGPILSLLLAGFLTPAAQAIPADVSFPKEAPAPRPAIPKPFRGDEQGGILYGKDYAFLIAAPKGWVMDDETGRAEGVDAVFYRRGESWVKSQAAMYANVVPKTPGQTDALAKVIATDIEESKQQDPLVKAEPVAPLSTGDGRTTATYMFTGPGTGRQKEQITYVDTPRAVVMLVLTSKSDAAYEQALADYVRLVRSFTFVADKVTVQYTGKGVAAKPHRKTMTRKRR